jgi:hypothetical protein
LSGGRAGVPISVSAWRWGRASGLHKCRRSDVAANWGSPVKLAANAGLPLPRLGAAEGSGQAQSHGKERKRIMKTKFFNQVGLFLSVRFGQSRRGQAGLRLSKMCSCPMPLCWREVGSPTQR